MRSRILFNTRLTNPLDQNGRAYWSRNTSPSLIKSLTLAITTLDIIPTRSRAAIKATLVVGILVEAAEVDKLAAVDTTTTTIMEAASTIEIKYNPYLFYII